MDPEFPIDGDELGSFLRSVTVGEDAMDISMLDGFLTALVVGPTNLPPSLWLPKVWGEGVRWPSERIAERMHTLVASWVVVVLYLRDSRSATLATLAGPVTGKELP